MLNKAIEIAAKAHNGQTDKGGNPYILHPLRILLNLDESESEAVKICAVLHDVIEDSDVSLDDLRAEGFSEEVLVTLDCLTKKDGEDYDDFISRILTNETACKVKNGDLADNMDLTRIPNPTDNDEERMEKYWKAAYRIMDALPNADAIPNRRAIEITGITEIHPSVSLNQFTNMFVRLIEAQGWFFGGRYKDVTDDENNDTPEASETPIITNEETQTIVEETQTITNEETPTIINEEPQKAPRYTNGELVEAQAALSSVLRKCVKCQDGKKLTTSQQTLLYRRIRALRLAVDLIEYEILRQGG